MNFNKMTCFDIIHSTGLASSISLERSILDAMNISGVNHSRFTFYNAEIFRVAASVPMMNEFGSFVRNVSEEMLKPILLKEIDKLSELEKVMYGL